MSGHSHWHSIKHQKSAADSKRSKAFSRLAREITVAAKGGGDPNFNPKLKIAIERAKGVNLPAENIERAIKRGTGELAGAALEPVIFEAYGPSGIAIIIEGITDNKKRALGEIKQILNQHQGKLANEGSVKWLFERKAAVTIEVTEQPSAAVLKEDLELKVIEAGAADFRWQGDSLDVYASPEEIEKVKKSLGEKGLKVSPVSLAWVAKEEISLADAGKEACQKLFEALDENEATQEIYSNLKI